MATTVTYRDFYPLSGSAETELTVLGIRPNQTTASDLSDGSADGITAVGSHLTWSASATPVTLIGFSSMGDPVVQIENGAQFLLSDRFYPLGADIGFTTAGGPYAYCFAPGTDIATPSGAVAVERLAMGDPVLTADGRTIPVRWIGRQTLATRFAGARARPVLIRAGALGAGLPQRDLTVTADHGMILDGLVINAGALVTGINIAFVPLAELPATVTYYHVETAAHDVILANGAAAETFVDYAGRAAFDNYADYLALYGAPQMIAEQRAPRITAARLLPDGIRARLALPPRAA